MTTKARAIERINFGTDFNGVEVPIAIQTWEIGDIAFHALMIGEELTFDEYCQVIEEIDDNTSSEFGTSEQEVDERIRNVIDERKGINVMLSYFVCGDIRTPTKPYCFACRHDLVKATYIKGSHMDTCLVNTTDMPCLICGENKGDNND